MLSEQEIQHNNNKKKNYSCLPKLVTMQNNNISVSVNNNQIHQNDVFSVLTINKQGSNSRYEDGGRVSRYRDTASVSTVITINIFRAIVLVKH